MKRKKYLLFIILTIVSGLVGGAISNYLFMARPAVAQESDLFPGLTPYIPTRIEWLTLELQAALGGEYSLFTEKFTLDIVKPGNESETIFIWVRYTPNVHREVMNMAIDSAKEVIRIRAEGYGWDRWVKIRENVKMMKPKEE